MKKDNLILKLGVSIIIFNLFSSSAFAQTKALVTADILNVRTSPQINSEIIGKIPKGEFVTVLESGEWSKIDYYSQEAYVSSQYLTYQGDSIDIINDVSTQTYFEETYLNAEIEIINILGECVYTNSFLGENKLYIDTKDFTSGVYFLKIKLDGNLFQQKMIKY